jgi:prophage DNA circulation protein
MTHDELTEATNVLTVVLNALIATLSGKRGRPQARVRNAIGSLQANAQTYITNAALGAPLRNAFDLAVAAGASRQAMDGVRVAMINQSVLTLPAVAIAISAIYFSLIEQARIISAMSFTSRDDVDALLGIMNTLFDPAEEFAADYTDDPSVYQSILEVHATLSQYLVAEAQPLPRMVTYSFSRRFPSLYLAQRLYQDARRADELKNENKVVHPAFCPSQGRCLSI